MERLTIDLSFYKAIAAGLIFLASMAPVVRPLRRQFLQASFEANQLGEALASGIFLGAAFFHMLPESISIFSHHTSIHYPIAEAICISGFLLLLLLERLSFGRPSQGGHHTIPYIIM